MYRWCMRVWVVLLTLLLMISLNLGYCFDCEPVPALADGFYRQTADGSGIEVKVEDGRLLRLGEKIDFEILDGWIGASNRSNTRFCLSVNVPYKQGLSMERHVFVFLGKFYEQGASGANGHEISSLEFYVQTETAAQAVADHFNFTLHKKRHPGHQMFVTYAPTKEVFNFGDAIDVELRIENVGTTTFAFMKGGRNRASRDNQYTFAAFCGHKGVPDIGSCMHFGGLAGPVILEPGNVFIDTVDLMKWFSFSETRASYSLTGTYFMEFVDPESDKFESIWSDYATGEFQLSVENKSNKSDAFVVRWGVWLTVAGSAICCLYWVLGRRKRLLNSK